MSMLEDRNLSCMSHWWPLLKETGVLCPDTEIIKGPDDAWKVLDGERPTGWDDFLDAMLTVAETMYPLFLRTGHGSDKHSWNETCYVESPQDLPPNVGRLIEWCGMVDLPCEYWAIREYLTPVSTFTAFRGMPVCSEARVFFKDHVIHSVVPYWPEDAIKKPSVENWKERLVHVNTRVINEAKLLALMSQPVADKFDGSWSLDWMMTENLGWMAIDMAVAGMSWGCPESLKE